MAAQIVTGTLVLVAYAFGFGHAFYLMKEK